MARALIVVAILALAVRGARAEDAAGAPAIAPGETPSSIERDAAAFTRDTPPPPPPPTPLRRLAAIGAALVPGVAVRGSGSWVLGERRTARRLFATGALGLGAMAIGGLAVGVSGGSEYTIIPGVPLVIVGAGLFLPTWFADVWVAAGGDRIVSAPHAPAPWRIEAGTTWLREPSRDRALIRTTGRLELGRLGLGAGTLLDAEGDAQTGELEARWRLRGAAPTGRTIRDGSRLVLRAAVRVHRDELDEVTLSTAEIEVIGRFDLRRLDANLAGNFLEISTGLGLERATYARDVHDTNSLLLGRLAWGAYLGTRSEVLAFYDHRRDSLAGGLAAGRAAGFLGSFGAAAELRLSGPWALYAELEVGNAWVSTLAVRYHGGAP